MSKENEVVFYTDGRHSSVYLYEPPMGIRQYVEPIDELLDLGIDTITYAVGDCVCSSMPIFQSLSSIFHFALSDK